MRGRAIGMTTLALVVGGVDGCTFGDLADYAVEACEPVAPGLDAYTHDSCDSLNTSRSDTCVVWQCDTHLRRCILAARDDDRDGDPAARCGGSDCDDDNPARSGRRADAPSATVRVPGGIGAGASTVLTAESGRNPTATWVAPLASGRYCLQATPVDVLAPLTGSCALLEAEPSLAPTQPLARWVSGTPAAVFIAQTPASGTCSGGAVSFRYGKTVSGATACDTTGAALPNFVIGADGTALLAYYATPHGTRADPSGCVSATPAALVIRKVSSVPSTSATLGLPQNLDGGVSFLPPALATLEEFTGVIVASPLSKGIGIWTLKAGTYAVGAKLVDESLAEVRGVTIATGREGEKSRLALVKQEGCDHASLHLAVIEFDIEANSLAALGDVGVTDTASVPAFHPSVAWVPPTQGGGWLVTWLQAGGQAFRRRFDFTGTPLGPASPIPSVKGVDVLAGAKGEAYFVRSVAVEDAFYRAPLVCP